MRNGFTASSSVLSRLTFKHRASLTGVNGEGGGGGGGAKNEEKNSFCSRSSRSEQKVFLLCANREFKKTTTAMATATSLNKRFNEQNNGCARAL